MRLSPVVAARKAREAQQATESAAAESAGEADNHRPAAAGQADGGDATSSNSHHPPRPKWCTRNGEIHAPPKHPQYSPGLAKKICELIAYGHTLRAICRRPGMPFFTTVYAWLRKYATFRKQYMLARRIARDQLEDEIREIADDESKDIVTLKDKDGKSRETLNPVAVQRTKVRVAARQKMIERHTPKKSGPYADKDEDLAGTGNKEKPGQDGILRYRLTEERRLAIIARRRAALEANKLRREGKLPPTPDTPGSATGK